MALTNQQRVEAERILDWVRKELSRLANGDNALLHNLRRRVMKQLEYDERGKPAERKKLKAQLKKRQNGLCLLCGEILTENPVADRLQADKGYTLANTRLLCRDCDGKEQERKGFK